MYAVAAALTLTGLGLLLSLARPSGPAKVYVFRMVGIIVGLTGLVMLIAALRGNPGESKRSTGLLIAGMMALAFGLIMGGFAIAFATTKPYDFNTSATGAN